jgi:hypothetical protein
LFPFELYAHLYMEDVVSNRGGIGGACKEKTISSSFFYKLDF